MAISAGQRSRWVVLVALTWAVGGDAWAQPNDPQAVPSSFASVKARVAVGEVVYVTDTSGRTVKGKLAGLSDDEVQVMVGGDVRSIAAADVRQIRWRQPDSLLNGVLIGALLGAIPGLYYLAADPNECTGMCPEEYALIAIGAGVGGLIDRALARTVTIYAAEPSGHTAKRLAIAPLVMRDRKGVLVAVRFERR